VAKELKVLAIHQGAELYGSDRSFLSSIAALRKSNKAAIIDVYLHEDGPLRNLLSQYANVVIRPISKLSKADIKKFNFMFLFYFTRNFFLIPKLRKYDIIYVNTVVILDFMVMLRFLSKSAKCFIHIREIQNGIIGRGLKALLSFSRANLIFNSEQTRKSFFKHKIPEHSVIQNGVSGFLDVPPIDNVMSLRVLMVGRVSKWKGQDFLLKAFKIFLDETQTNSKLRFVGSPFKGQEFLMEELERNIVDLGLSEQVEFFPFTENIAELYEWSNLVVVPSKKPEPFGRVAIEAMSAERTVIVANHGGLTDIVVDKVTGLKFLPNDTLSLVNTLKYMHENPKEMQSMGAEARLRFTNFYSEDIYQRNLINILEINSFLKV